LYCRNIHSQITDFTNITKKIIKHIPEFKALKPQFFQDYSPAHRNPRVFTIDPEGAKDFDDAFSVMLDSPFVATVRIYIANVYAWMETLNLWSAFGNRISTIYLPDSKRPMLPSVLSDNICSLVADETAKLTFCMEVRVDLNYPLIIHGSIRFLNLSTKIDKNYVYESISLVSDTNYQLLHRCTKSLDPSIKDSHDVVAFWMIQMNTICGNRLNQKGVGIFREVSLNREEDPEPQFHELPLNSSILLKNWKNASGKYTLFDNTKAIPHSALHLFSSKVPPKGVVMSEECAADCASKMRNCVKKESYVHITSPIRRLVDLLNLIAFQHSMVLVERISEEAETFLNTWQSKLTEINRQMHAAKKVQIDCDLLHRCTAHPEWMQHPHRGVIFDRFERPDGTYSYMVHLSDLNILGRVVVQEKYVNYSLLDFKLFVFRDSDKIKRKIRLAVVY